MNNTETNTIARPAYTADDLITLRAAAVNAVAKFLRGEKAYLAAGIKGGYLADSAMDGLTIDVDASTVRAQGILSGGEWTVSVRVESEFDIVDFDATPSFHRAGSWAVSGFSIREDRRWRK